MQHYDDFYYRDAYASTVMNTIYEEQFNTWKPKVVR